MALRPVEDRTTKTQSIFRRSFALSPKIQLPASTQKSTFQIAPVSNPLKLTDEYTRLPLIAQARPTNNLSFCKKPTNKVKMTDVLAVKIVLRVAKYKPCKLSTFSKALEHLRNGSVSSAHAQKVVPYLIKWFKHPLFYSMAMNTFVSLAAHNKPKLGSVLTNKGAKAIRARFKDSNESVRRNAIYNYAFLLDLANLSLTEVKAVGPVLRDRIANDSESEVRSKAEYAYSKLYDSQWVKKTSKREAIAGVRCLRKASVKYKRMRAGGATMAYTKAAVKLDRSAANHEATELYKLRKSKDISIRYLGINSFGIIANYHVSKIKAKSLKKWEKLLWSVISSPLPRPSGRLIPYRESAARSDLRPNAVSAYSYVISRHKGAALDKAVLKLVTYIADKQLEVRIKTIHSLESLFPKLGSKAKHRISRAIRSRFKDSDSMVKRAALAFYRDTICKHVNKAELIAAKTALQIPLKDNNPLVRRDAQKALAAINKRLQP